MEDASIVEDGVTNALTDGITKRNITSEMKTDKDIALITDIPSGSETALCPILR